MTGFGWLKLVFGWLSKGPLDRILSTIDRKVDSETERRRIKAQTVQTYIETRPGWLKAGGLLTLLLFAIPAALWRGSVYIYSMLFCNVCMFPQTWAIGDIPPGFKEVDFWIVLASIGALGIFAMRK